MNIMFYSLYHPSTMIGGIERITCRLVGLFSQKGYNVYCMYCAQHERKANKIDAIIKDEIYISNIKEEFVKARDFIEDNKINVIINQSFFVGNISNSILEKGDFSNMVFDCGYLKRIVDTIYHKCYLFSCHHTSPKSEYLGIPKNIHRIITDARSISSFIWGCRNIGRYIKIKLKYKHIVDEYYNEMYRCSDKLILLSSSFRNDWAAILKEKDIPKAISIPNMVSYNEYFKAEDIKLKEKIALVVARLDEGQKKISRILKVWKDIETTDTLKDWNLVIVGTGKDETKYKQYVQGNLKRASFEGFRNPLNYYKKSSLFLMTSAFEGFGITLIEAQQFGCVPIALNTYEALSDIVEDGVNGYVADDLMEFEEKLKRLMIESKLREEMALTAMESSKKFSEDQVLNKWESLFQELS